MDKSKENFSCYWKYYCNRVIVLFKTGTATGLTPFYSGLLGIKNGFTKTTEGAGKHAKAITGVNTAAVKTTVGLVGLAVSMYEAYDAGKALASGSKDAEDAMTQLGLSIAGAAASGALIGSVIAPRNWNSNRSSCRCYSRSGSGYCRI